MRDIDIGGRLDFSLGGRHQESPAGRTILVDHVSDFLRIIRDHRAEIFKLHRLPDPPALFDFFGQRFEEFLGDPAMAIAGQAAENLLRMLGKGFGHAARGAIIVQIQRFGLVGRLPVGPHPHEGVLEDRQLVGVVADIVQQPREQTIRDLSAGHLHRARDGCFALVAIEAGDQELALVHRVGQTGESAAIPQEI